MDKFAFFISGHLIFSVIFLFLYFGYVAKTRSDIAQGSRKRILFILLWVCLSLVISVFHGILPEIFGQSFFKGEFHIYLGLFFVKMAVIWLIVCSFRIQQKIGISGMEMKFLRRIGLVFFIGQVLLLLGGLFYFADIPSVFLLAIATVSFFLGSAPADR